MSRFRLTLIIGLVAALAVLMLPMSFASETERPIKVGIKSGSVTDATTTLTSTSGFKFGIVENGIFTDTGFTVPLNTLYVVKNTKLVGDIIGVPGGTTGTYFGPYHIQIGPVYPSYAEMKILLDQTLPMVPGVYAAYDGGWSVYAGAYMSEAERTLRLGEITALLPGQSVVAAPVNGKAVMAVDTTTIYLYYDTSDAAFAYMPQVQGDLTGFESRKYRGAIGVRRYTDSDPTVINYVGIDKYLYGVVPREMSGTWPLEALKAQAVAGRSYAIVSTNKHSKWGFDVCNLQDCQVYGGASSEQPLSNDAVDETVGKLLTYDNKVVQAYFHSNSGGRTENSEYVWSAVVPYLKSVDDPYSLGQPSATWTKSYTPAQIDTLLKSKSINIGPIIGIYVTKVSPNGRALETVFVGRDGDYVTSKEKARFMLGTYDIRSTWYTINSGSGSGLAVESGSSVNTLPQTGFVIESASGQSTFTSTAQLTVQSASGVTTAMPAITDQIVFTGYGFGHGIGMSQWGAKKMAELGMDYTKILTHYYKNTIVK